MYEPLNTYQLPASWRSELIPRPPNPGIAIASRSSEIHAVGRLRHELLVEAGTAKLMQSDGSARIFLEPADENSLILHARVDQGHERLDGCLAALRMTSALDASGDDELCAVLEMAGLSPGQYPSTVLISQPVLRNVVHARLLFPQLFTYAYQIALVNGFETAVLAALPKMGAYFEGVGFVSTRLRRSPSKSGTREVLTLDLLDRSRLLLVKSPFLAILDASPDNQRRLRKPKVARSHRQGSLQPPVP